jgi:hypothetical protein
VASHIPSAYNRRGDPVEKSNKWLAGVLTTIGTGIILWWLTHEGGPLNRSQAHLSIISWTYKQVQDPLASLSPSDPTLSADGTVTIHNDGEKTAENCKVYDAQDRWISNFATPFGVPPKEDVPVSVSVWFRVSERNRHLSVFGNNAFNATARVKCDKSVSSNVFNTLMYLKQASH